MKISKRYVDAIMITKEQIVEISKKNIGKIPACTILGIKSAYQLDKLCKEYKIEWPDYNAYRKSRPDIDKQWMIDNWVNTNKSMHQLAIENNVSEGLLDSRRAKYKLEKSFKYQIDINKLFNLKDPNIYYIAGLAATDGYFPKNQNALEIELSGESDIKLLKDISRYFDDKCVLKSYDKNKHAYRLRISARELNNFFEQNFNIPQRAKSYDVGIPKYFYNEDCVKAYIRGCFDGDGSLTKDGKSVTLLNASDDFILGLKSILEEYDVANIKYYKEKRITSNNETVYYPIIGVYGKEAYKFLNWIYSTDFNIFKLERKYTRFKNNWNMLTEHLK